MYHAATGLETLALGKQEHALDLLVQDLRWPPQEGVCCLSKDPARIIPVSGLTSADTSRGYPCSNADLY